MKLLRWGTAGAERPGMLAPDGSIRNLGGVLTDLSGAALSPESLARLAALDPATLPVVAPGTRLGPPVAGTGKVICIGLNYADHAEEAGMAVPPEPVIFLKASSAISGPDDPVELPSGAEKLDWEVELAFVIGTRAKYVEEADAMAHVAGYMLANDVSERAFQTERSGQWTKGKSHDTFFPCGPWLVTRDEIADPQALALGASVNGAVMQAGTTATMVYGVRFLVSYLSRFMTLEPGDIVTTGTPPGVGMGMKPPRFLQPGDVVALTGEGLGTQSQRVVPA
ncbi:FAA hydrolase family protein [Sinirhodobacter ferrireducens]|uniref:FAA hydrolase family protein n=1 Tax=Paenirhodobacter ferrireducens TaxID=1215032 RepID=A0A443LTK1_9RHOB|nr:fumarylacetoacetate hydrolase family protein [Sinirhodobacter ferrireducens]RWR52496.1 FAA hydrolase family protein [Sinirhodobacter ferrireducens]